jgi:epoxyqueuosine reductase QueG
VGELDEARWWTIRPARSRQPKTYRCPFCGRLLHAMSEHALIAPEGDVERRRHAHLECVARARLPTEPRRPGLLRRLRDRLS